MPKVNDRVYQVDDVLGGPTLLVDDEYLTLVDTGVPDSEGAILALVESLGREPGDLRQVLLTHADRDHVGSLAAIVAATGAEVYAHAHDAEVAEGKREARNGQFVQFPATVDHIVADGQTLPLHGGIKVVETLGHTLGHVSYYLTGDGVLIAGDCINNREGLSDSATSAPQNTVDFDLARAAVKRIAALEPSSIVCGHGPPIVEGAAAALTALAERV